MKAREIFDLYLKGVCPILECNSGIESLEVDPDTGMRGKLKGINIVDLDEEYEHLVFTIDFGIYEEYNRGFAKANYYNESHEPCETWFEQEWYGKEKNHVEIYLEYTDDVFDVAQNDLYEEFKKEGGNTTYVSWLENKVREFMGKV